MEYAKLLGMTEEEVAQYFALKQPQLKYRLNCTVDPLQKTEQQEIEKKTEKRVIRIKKTKDCFEILVGYFMLPDYILR